MLDSDLARLYECKNGTKEINQAVKNNPNKFPERFSFILSDKEVMDLRSKFLTTNYSNMSRSKPRVFTEQGIAMLATIIKSKKAVETSIKIMDAFIVMKKYISSGLLELKFLEHDKRIETIEDYLFDIKEPSNKIIFDGKTYDGYSTFLDILNASKSEIIIIDNYIDKGILDILKNTRKKITIITNKYNNTDYEKYKSQYNNVTLKINNNIHDRFVIIDRKVLYHCGTSFKDLGKKLFVISKIESKVILNDLLKYLDK